MHKLLSAALVLAVAATPAAAQTLVIPPGPAGSEIGPFGQDPLLGAIPAIGQTFVPLNNFLQSFAFSLRDDAGTGANLLYQAYIAPFTGGVAGVPIYTSDIRQGSTVVADGGARFVFAASGTPLNLSVDPTQTYVAFLSIAGTSGLFTTGTNAVILADGDPYAAGDLVVDFGNGLELQQGADLAFDATFTRVAVSAVPEPATLALVFGGVAVLGAVRRRRLV